MFGPGCWYLSVHKLSEIGMNAQTCHCRLWVDAVFIYIFQQGQNKVGLSNSEVAQYRNLHRYEWKQEIHTGLWWWNGFGLLWKNNASVLLPLHEMCKTVASSDVQIVCIGWKCVLWSFFFRFIKFLNVDFFFGSINFSCFCSSFHYQTWYPILCFFFLINLKRIKLCVN